MTLHGTSHPRWYGPALMPLVLAWILALVTGVAALFDKHWTIGFAGLGGFVVGLAITVLISKLVGSKLELDETSVRATSRRGKVTEIRWTEPHQILFRAVAVRSGAVVSSKATVSTPDGRRIEIVEAFGNPANKGMVDAAVSHSSAAKWPELERRLRAGETLQFGHVSVSLTEVRVGSTLFPVRDQPLVDVTAGRIEVRARDGRASQAVHVREVPNFRSLARALQAVLSGSEPRSSSAASPGRPIRDVSQPS